MPGLRLTDVSKSFDGKEVLKDICLDLPEGELLVVLGPSGCGKSTLLRLIAGLETIDNGEIHIGDRRVDDLQPKDRQVAMVFQNYSLYPHMTVAKNLAFPLKVAGSKRDTIKKRVVEVAQLLSLADKLEVRPGKLSGGQRQRVALGRAIIRKPSVFLLDEPLSNLDADLRTRMRREIVRIQKTLQTTTVHVTHDQAEALTMADRIAVVNEGQIVQVGTPEELYQQPADLFVAGFLGSPPINRVPVRVQDAILTPFNVKAPQFGAMPPGHEAILGVRPEDVRILKDGDFEAEVAACEYLGDQYVITLTFRDITLKASTCHRAHRPCTRVRFSLAVDDILLFDPRTGVRMESR